jgi:hypothetical protein
MTVIGTFDSLAEAAKLTMSVLLPGIVKEVYNIGQLWPRMPIAQLDGYSMKYNREVLPSEGQFLGIGDEIQSDADVAFTQVEVFLKRYIKQRDIDKFIIKTWANVNDIDAQAIMEVTRGVTEGLESQLVYSSSTTNTNAFDSLHTLVTSGQTLHQGSGTTGAALSLNNLDKLIDLVRPRPDWILMNRNLWRRLSQVARGGTTSFPLVWGEVDMENGMGRRALYYDGVEIIPSDYITQTETIASAAFALKVGGATSTIFAGRFGQLTEGGLCMLMGNPLLEPLKIDSLENKDASRYRMVTYAAPALGSTKALACIDGITDVAMVA